MIATPAVSFPTPKALFKAHALAFAACFALPFLALAQEKSSAEEDAASEKDSVERTTTKVDDVTVHHPVDDADLVELLAPTIRSFNTIRGYKVREETRSFLKAYESDDVRNNLRKLLQTLFASNYPDEHFDQNCDIRVEELKKIIEAWRAWSSEIDELYLWDREGAAPYATGIGDDSYEFPQIHFSNRGKNFDLQTPITAEGYGIHAFATGESGAHKMRLDLPLIYKPGTPVEEIIKYHREFIRALPDLLRKSAVGPLAVRIAPWMLENMALDELQSHIFDPSSRDGILPFAIARYLTAVTNINDNSEAKRKNIKAALLHVEGDTPTAIKATLAEFEKVDPLAPPQDDSPEAENMRRMSANIVAYALLNSATKGENNTLFQRFEKTGIDIPENGFSEESFIAAVDKIVDDREGAETFREIVDEQKKQLIEGIRTKVAEVEKDAAPDEATSLPANPTAKPLPSLERTTSDFDGFEISHPASLTDIVAEVAPDFVKNIRDARDQAEEAFDKQKSLSVEITEEDGEALTRYGLDADADSLQRWALGSSAFMNPRSPMMTLLGTEKAQIWLKAEILSYLKSGGEVDHFRLKPGGENFSFDFEFNAKLPLSEIEDGEQVAELMASEKPFVLPIIVDKSLDEEVTAADLREQAKGLFDPADKDAAIDPDKLRLINPRQTYFFAVHETVEAQLIGSTIGSAGRRWFCDGLSNWIAMQECERRYGKGVGMEVFESMYKPATYNPLANKVDLFAWPAVENLPPNPEYEHAHYYFATRAILAACRDQEPDFVKNWLNEIRKTPHNRVNTSHVIAAYEKLTGEDLRMIVEGVTKN